jgi:hypothetical protein
MQPLARHLWCALALALLATASPAAAIVLDWDSATWTNGSLSNSFDVDPYRAGNDLTVTISGSTAQLQPGIVAPNPPSPTITTGLEGGLSPGQKSLELAVNFTSQSQFITVTVDFSALYAQGVENVSFTIFDVDFDDVNGSSPSHYQDQLRSISALSIDGTTAVAPTITVSPNNSRTGTGLAQVVTGNVSTVDTGAGSGAGNVTISFGTSWIKSFTFTYGSGTGTTNDPTYQHIGIHDISFTPVPEINPAWSAVLSCAAAAGLVLRHRSICRRKK